MLSFSNALQLYFVFSCVFPSSFPKSNVWHLARLNYLQFAGKKKPHQFNSVTCSLPVKTSDHTCFHVATTWRRIHAIALKKARKLQITSLAGCMLTCLQFAGEFISSVIADYLQLKVLLCRIADIFACDCVGILSCVCDCFCLGLPSIFICAPSVFSCKLQVFLPAKAGNFACLCRANYQDSACNITCTKPVVFKLIYMHLQAIRLSSARGACRVEAGKLTCFYK